MPPVRRALVYPVRLSVRPNSGLGGRLSPPPGGGAHGGGLSPPRGGHDSDDPGSRRRRRVSSSSQAPATPAPVTVPGGAVPAGWGVEASGEVHVAAAVDALNPRRSLLSSQFPKSGLLLLRGTPRLPCEIARPLRAL